MSSDNIKRIDIKEFRELGFLQEANRLFFHPHGLALEVRVDDETGEETLGGIWDYRDDPEGIIFGTGSQMKQAKADRVVEERLRHRPARAKLFGVPHIADAMLFGNTFDIEPIDWCGG